ncbi:MAG: helix-turn-helix transcriptional regulator [Pseudooceanicola sp.]
MSADNNAGRNGPRVPNAFAPVVLGEYLSRARPGSVWFSRGSDARHDGPLRSFQLAARLSELAVVPLSIDKGTADFIELHFRADLTHEQHAALTMLATSLAQTWVNRAPGTFARTMQMARPEQVSDISDDAPILSFENPARLSRTEYRVCVLLNRGLSTQDVRETLGITEATLRTHLRNIYAKTDTAGMAQLLFKLVSSESLATAAAG